jgi:hypothetical protein
MKTILVTDARQPVQEFLEQLLAEHGDDVTGPQPDLVLTPDDSTSAAGDRPGGGRAPRRLRARNSVNNH